VSLLSDKEISIPVTVIRGVDYHVTTDLDIISESYSSSRVDPNMIVEVDVSPYPEVPSSLDDDSLVNSEVFSYHGDPSSKTSHLDIVRERLKDIDPKIIDSEMKIIV